MGTIALLAVLVGPGAGEDGVNARVLAFARGRVGERVGNGDCGAFVKAALHAAGARPPRAGPKWGEELAGPELARPGDVLQFENVVIRGSATRGLRTRTWAYHFPNHTAIVAGVRRLKGASRLTILHQNVGINEPDEGKRKVVQEWELNLSEVREGTIRAYRPVAAD